MNIDKIQIEDRYRRDLGDLNSLAASIKSEGLLHPVVVTNDLRLIAGQRRLEACRTLGWTEVPVRFVERTVDAASVLRMERDENTCRKDMTPSECVALGRALEELERPKAREAQAHGRTAPGRNASVPPNESVGEPRRERFDTREVVAPAVGMSTATYSRAKQLIDAAEEGDGEAMAQVIEMDRTGKVTKPYETWKGRKVKERQAEPSRRFNRQDREGRADLIAELAAQGYTSQQMSKECGVLPGRVREIARSFDIDVPADRMVGRKRRIDWTAAMSSTVTSLEMWATALNDLDFSEVDWSEADEWVRSLTASRKELSQFITQIEKQIKEQTHVV